MNLPHAVIAEKCSVSQKQLSIVKELLDKGATIPFIARYRKELTLGLDEVSLENIKTHIDLYSRISARKLSIIKQLKEKDENFNKLINSIEKCWNMEEIEDLYLPYKTTKKTKASIAIEAGLDSLAKMILTQIEPISQKQIIQFKSVSFSSYETIIEGTVDILSKWISERKKVRYELRKKLWHEGVIISKKKSSINVKADQEKYSDYFTYEEPAKKIKSHRYLALQRGMSDGVLSISLKIDKKSAIDLISSIIIKDQGSVEILKKAIENSWIKILKPSLDKEIFQRIKEISDNQAISIFAENLRQLLLQPPVHGKRILAIDPGYRSGCKLVCLTAQGDLLNNETIYPHAPQNEMGMAKKKIAGLIEQYKLDAITIGNGTASRETERLVKNIRFNRKVNVYIVNEAGASVYSASSIARKEFPEYDVTVRGAISIGRRLIDPLSELVKIDPQSIGVGQYQHDVNQTLLKEKLDGVVVSVVNSVGIDLNTASEYLLSYVSGVGPKLAENIVKYRREKGPFKKRLELYDVPKLGDKIFEQAAGFLRVKDGKDPLDNSAVHPEFYGELKKICKNAGVRVDDLIGNKEKIDEIDWSKYYTDKFGEATFNDVKEELAKPGIDPRKVIFQLEFDKDLKSINDLEIGKVVPGIINNVTNFGAFVDIGIKENGLIHISNLCNEYVDDPSKVVKIHQHVKAKIISVDKERKRIGLSLKDLD